MNGSIAMDLRPRQSAFEVVPYLCPQEEGTTQAYSEKINEHSRHITL